MTPPQLSSTSTTAAFALLNAFVWNNIMHLRQQVRHHSAIKGPASRALSYNLMLHRDKGKLAKLNELLCLDA